MIRYRLDALEFRPEGHYAFGVARLHVHVGPVKVADFLLVRALRKLAGRRLFDNRPDGLLGLVAKNRKTAVAPLVGRDLRFGEPPAVYVGKEVVARADAGIHVLQLHAGFHVGWRPCCPGGFLLLAAGGQGHHRGGHQ